MSLRRRPAAPPSRGHRRTPSGCFSLIETPSGGEGASTERTRTTSLSWLIGHTPDHTLLDVGHAGDAAAFAVDDGRIDRFSELLVAINKSTRITLANGHRGSLSDLRTGIGVEVTGVWNNRLDEVTSTSSIAIYTLPHGKGKRKP